jgi:hypothetical protein
MSQDDEKKFTKLEVAGIVIGSILGLLLIGFLIYVVITHYNKKNPFILVPTYSEEFFEFDAVPGPVFV